jgi:hypothetical protein
MSASFKEIWNFLKDHVCFLKNIFKEYIDLQESIEKLFYSFHYQDHENNLIFRYDNAKHKPDLGYTNHKHIQNKIIESEIPNIEQVILYQFTKV